MAKKNNLCLPKRPVASLQRGMRTGRPMALKTAYLTGRDDTRPQNDISPATSSSSRWTPALIAKVDDHPENQWRQPSMNDLTLKEQSAGSLISSSPPPRHMTMHMHLSRAFNIQYSNIYDLKLASQTLYHFNNAQAPTTCILHSASNVIPTSKEDNDNIHNTISTTAISTANKKKNLCLPKQLVTSFLVPYVWQTGRDGMTALYY